MASSSPTAYPALSGDADADVVIVGGGIAGLCTAWELTEAGRSVVLLEADRIAAGVTGHSTGKLSALHTFAYSRLRDSSGPGAARLYARSQQTAVERVAALVAKLDIDCDLERLPAYTYAESPDGVDRIRAEARAAAEAGLPASFVTECGLPFPIAGAVRVEGQAQFHPRKYLLALADDLTRRGGRIFERTRAVRLREGDPCVVTTASGHLVTAQHVVVATHYPVFDRAMLFGRLQPRRALVVAAAIDGGRDPDGAYLTPEQNTRSVRTTPGRDGQRLLIVTGEHFTPGDGDVTERWQRLMAWTHRRFPGTEVTWRWATQDNWTADEVPLVGRFHPGSECVHVATGFGGWDMSSGVMAGQLLAATLTDTPVEWAELYRPRRFMPVVEAGTLLTMHAQTEARVRPSHADSIAEVEAGTGAIVRVAGQQRAIYRDEGGVAHAVSARCTHLGCVVRFNDAETAWECPCHGSRFAVDGCVLQGPANRPLDRYGPKASSTLP